MNVIHEAASLQRLNLNLFRVFDVVYREGNLTRAAEVLHLSPSALSHALARLREHLGDALFIRQVRGVTPTPLAHRLAPRVREALHALQLSLDSSRHFDPRQDLTRLTLGMPDEVEPMLLPALATRLRAAAPQLILASVPLDRKQLKTDLASGRLDLALDLAQSTSDELGHECLLREPFCVVASRRHWRGDLTRSAYLRAQHVVVSKRRSGLALEDLSLSRRGIQRQVVLRCQHYESACSLVESSDLLLTMPRQYARKLNAHLKNRLHCLPLPLPVFELHLYWHRQSQSTAASQWLRDKVLQQITRMHRQRTTRRKP